MSGHADTAALIEDAQERGGSMRWQAAVDALEADLLRQADRIAWLEGEVAGWRIKLADARVALERIAEQQQLVLSLIQRNGFVFEDIGSEPGNWQHLAFTATSARSTAWRAPRSKTMKRSTNAKTGGHP